MFPVLLLPESFVFLAVEFYLDTADLLSSLAVKPPDSYVKLRV